MSQENIDTQKYLADREQDILDHRQLEWKMNHLLSCAQGTLEEWLAVPFLSQNLLPAERDEWASGILGRLKSILKARDTCLTCGERYATWDGQPPHVCIDERK